MIDLSIIILNHNAKDFLKNCLNSIKKSSSHNLKIEILVADNGSSDGSIQMIKKYFPEVELIDNNKNIGLAAGNNRVVPKSKGKYILFLNPDTILGKDTLSKMFSFMESNIDVGGSTCRVELADGSIDESCHRGFPTPWNSFCHFSGLEKIFLKSKIFSGYTLGHLSIKEVHQIDSASGAFLMVRREAGEQINWWDEDYFFYGEDLEFCYCLAQKGWKVYYCPFTKIVHFRGISSGIKKHSKQISTSNRDTRIVATKASTDAMRIFYKKHYEQKYHFFVNFLVNTGINIIEKIRIDKIR